MIYKEIDHYLVTLEVASKQEAFNLVIYWILHLIKKGDILDRACVKTPRKPNVYKQIRPSIQKYDRLIFLKWKDRFRIFRIMYSIN